MSRVNRVFSAIRRTPYQSLSAILITSITFFVLTTLTLFLLGTNRLLSYFESKPQVTAFFKDTATNQDIDALKAKIQQTTLVDNLTYVSKEEALELYREQNKDNPLLLEMVTADILPSSLEVSSTSVDGLEAIAAVMQDSPHIEEVVYQKDVIDSLRKWLFGIRLTGIVLTATLLFVSMTTLIVIVSLKFRSKKTEMYTLTLLGATKWYIKAPFMTEAILYGCLGAFIGWGISYVLLLYLTPNIISFMGDISLLPVPVWAMGIVLLAQLAVGCILGTFASLIATRRLGR